MQAANPRFGWRQPDAPESEETHQGDGLGLELREASSIDYEFDKARENAEHLDTFGR